MSLWTTLNGSARHENFGAVCTKLWTNCYCTCTWVETCIVIARSAHILSYDALAKKRKNNSNRLEENIVSTCPPEILHRITEITCHLTVDCGEARWLGGSSLSGRGSEVMKSEKKARVLDGVAVSESGNRVGLMVVQTIFLSPASFRGAIHTGGLSGYFAWKEMQHTVRAVYYKS